MDIIQQRKNTSESFSLPTSQHYIMASRPNDQYPRYTPIDMGSDILPANFTIWPPTPQIGSGKSQQNGSATFTYSLPDYASSTPAWDSSILSLSDGQSMAPNGVGIVTQFDSPIDGEWNKFQGLEDDSTALDKNHIGGSWDKPRGGGYMQSLDSDLSKLGSSYDSNDSSGVLDSSRYGYSTQSSYEENSVSMVNAVRRMSDASTSLSGQEPLVRTASDLSSSYNEYSQYDVPPLDYNHKTPMTTSLCSTPLSPVMSPRQTARSQIRSGSRGRTTPSPRPTARSAPYGLDGNRNKRWSTGSYFPTTGKLPAYLSSQVDNLLPQSRGVHSHHTSPTCSTVHPHTHHQHQSHQPHMQQHQSYSNHLIMSHASHPFPRGILPSSDPHDMPGSMMGYPFFRGILGSNVEPNHSHYTDLTDPPDLYASLAEEQIPPPPEDMNPEDPDMKPHEQELRFEGDLYTPRWVRGHGNKREGWCGICKPGRWLVLKNSAFWYDKSFTHGISAATGQQFVEPKEVRRMDGNPDVWEGLCHSCNDWVALVSNKKKGTTWFRHAYKCHTHPKVKDAPKRRRESSHNKAAVAAAAAAAVAAAAKQKLDQSSTSSASSISSSPPYASTSVPPSVGSTTSTSSSTMANSQSAQSQQGINHAHHLYNINNIKPEFNWR